MRGTTFMSSAQDNQLDLLTRSVHALLQWAESHPLTQWEQEGTLSALRIELEEAMKTSTSRDVAVNGRRADR
jgi:hypothetical protein